MVVSKSKHESLSCSWIFYFCQPGQASRKWVNVLLSVNSMLFVCWTDRSTWTCSYKSSDFLPLRCFAEKTNQNNNNNKEWKKDFYYPARHTGKKTLSKAGGSQSLPWGGVGWYMRGWETERGEEEFGVQLRVFERVIFSQLRIGQFEQRQENSSPFRVNIP